MKNTKYAVLDQNKDKLEQFIRGAMLGDGCIPKIQTAGKNYRLTFGHSEKQYDYLLWKYEFLQLYQLDGKIVRNVNTSSRYKNNQCISYHFKSKTHPIFTEYRDKYYMNNKRTINRNDISKMDEFALAIWYMDDGNISRPKNKSAFIELNTQSFSKEDTLFLCQLLKKKWDIQSNRMNYSGVIRITVESSKRFLNLIEPYKHENLSYKWVL